jgi:hypothetical protein
LFGLVFRSVTGFPELKKYGKIFYRRFSSLIEFYPILIQFDILENFGGPFIILPKPGA